MASCRPPEGEVSEARRPQSRVAAALHRVGSTMRTSIRQMFRVRDMRLTSSLLLGIWLAVALIYYGMIMFNTSLQVSDQPCNSGAAPNHRGPRLSSEDYRDVFITTFGEVRTARSRSAVRWACTRQDVYARSVPCGLARVGAFCV